jgi:hypothetical protein
MSKRKQHSPDLKAKVAAHSDTIRTLIPILPGQGFRRHPDTIPGDPDKRI